MTTNEKLKPAQVREFRNISHHYRFLFNSNFDKQTNERNFFIKSVKVMEKDDEYRMDNRFYRAVVTHVKEKGTRLNRVQAMYQFRLENVIIIKGQFIFNDIIFTFPEMKRMLNYKNNEKIVATVKFLLIRDTLSVSICDGEYRILSTNKHKNHYHYYNNLEGLDYEDRPYLWF